MRTEMPTSAPAPPSPRMYLPGSLALSRVEQRVVEGWVKKKGMKKIGRQKK